MDSDANPDIRSKIFEIGLVCFENGYTLWVETRIDVANSKIICSTLFFTLTLPLAENHHW